jgi:phenylpropionate dioxygenase-like ring-hydroxylating dioxygenase large terminal subunit
MTKMYLRNCWYVVAWDYELPRGAPISRRLLDEQVVLYRNTRREVVALEDRCALRFAPLSLARLEGDDIRCMYHGLKFCSTGRCVEIPNQDRSLSGWRFAHIR